MDRFEPYPPTVGAAVPSPCAAFFPGPLGQCISETYPWQTRKNRVNKNRMCMRVLLFESVFVH